jgi:hypothetical protein
MAGFNIFLRVTESRTNMAHEKRHQHSGDRSQQRSRGFRA